MHSLSEKGTTFVDPRHAFGLKYKESVSNHEKE